MGMWVNFPKNTPNWPHTPSCVESCPSAKDLLCFSPVLHLCCAVKFWMSLGSLWILLGSLMEQPHWWLPGPGAPSCLTPVQLGFGGYLGSFWGILWINHCCVLLRNVAAEGWPQGKAGMLVLGWKVAAGKLLYWPKFEVHAVFWDLWISRTAEWL